MRIFICKVENGRIPKYVSESIRRLLEKKREGLIKISIEDYVSSRTNPQNRYYWKVIVGGIKDHMKASGVCTSAEGIHEYIKNVLCPDICEVETVERIFDFDYQFKKKTTAKLTTEQFSELCERVRAWAAENGLQLPLPNEQWEFIEQAQTAKAY